MPTLQELMKKHGVSPANTSRKPTRQRLLDQADNMLTKLKPMKSASELDSKSSTADWWANKPTADGKRYVCMKYGGNSVANSGTHVDDTIAAVRSIIKTFKQIIEESDADTWRAEEARREELAAKRKAKKADSSA